MRINTRRRRSFVAMLAVVAVVAAGAVVAGVGRAAADCPPGTFRAGPVRELAPDLRAQLPPQWQGGVDIELPAYLRGGCLPVKPPESASELALRDLQMASIRTAPFDYVPEGALLAAAEERQAFLQQPAGAVRGADGVLEPYGRGPIIFDDPRYGSVNGSGIVDSTGRIDDFHYDAATNQLFAAIGTSGVWLSDDQGETWRTISSSLPTNTASVVTFTPSGGPDGTVVVLTGEHTFGGFAFTGLGAYWSTDLGETWTRAEGPPDGTLGFAIEVDPTAPDTVYAATGRGLWRSTDAGRTYTNVDLPVGTCAGDYNTETCNFAHFVTDVEIKEPGGVGADTEGGTVLAAVGWRAGTFVGPDDLVQSEGNGIYLSATGEPGTFEHLPGLADAAGGQDALGRIEVGAAIGPAQDHDVIYAMVEDAELFNGGPPFSPIPLDAPLGANPTVFNGIYFSGDFGESWTQLADDQEVATACPVNESVFCIPGLIHPGVQAWYNMWVEPDPTRQTAAGIPTRVIFGLEEVWQNRFTAVPAPVDNPAVSFEVIGAYYGSVDCLLVATNCGLNREVGVTTTHPDQHDGVFIPQENGGVKLVVGHDGGISSQIADDAGQFSQETWRLEQDDSGLETLLPYSAVWANDGVAYAGLQDNGHIRIAPDEEFATFETFGADGTFAAVDPANSDYVIESTQNAGMNLSLDGGQTWTGMTMPADNVRFVNPFVMDPLNADHIATGGRQIVENLTASTTPTEWATVFDLGTSEREPVVETDAPAPPNQQTAIDTRGDATYVGFCGPCDILNQPYPFQNGIATNVGAEDLPEAGTSAGWHFAAAEGLPNRYITSVAIDPYDATQRTVYVTLGGYSRRWVGPGSQLDDNPDVGEGHIFKSTDAGETFTDISGDFPDMPALWVEPRGDQLLIGSELGAWISSDTDGGRYAVLGGDQLPAVVVLSIQLKADDPNQALLGTYGRSLWRYTFPEGGAAEIRRLAGSERIATAVAISQDVYDTAATVAIARADVYADALAGAPLAFREDAPLLLTQSGGLADAVRGEIARLGATRAVLFGGTTALSPQVEADLAAVGITEIVRYGGPNRFDTARQVAEELGGDTVYVVKGNDADPTRGWPDAMSIAPVASHQGFPILLTETDRLPEETVAAISAIGATKGRIVGGTAAVSEAIEAELDASLSLGTRIAGPDRFATSVAAAEVGEEAGLSPANLWLARGGNFPDALSGGPTVAATGGVLVLVNDADLDDSPASRDYIVEHACDVRLARVLGGTAAIAQGVEDAVRAIFSGAGCTTDLPPPPDPAPIPGPAGGEELPSGPVLAGPFAFEGDAEGWTVETASPGLPPSSWEIGDGGHDSESSFQVLPYGEEVDTTLLSPELEAPGGEVTLAWWTTFDIEGDGFDEVAVEWSSDGETWSSLEILGGQNVGYPEFGVQTTTFDAPAGPLQVRFNFYSDEICSSTGGPLCARQDGYEGVRIDDVALHGPE